MLSSWLPACTPRHPGNPHSSFLRYSSNPDAALAKLVRNMSNKQRNNNLRILIKVAGFLLSTMFLVFLGHVLNPVPRYIESSQLTHHSTQTP